MSAEQVKGLFGEGEHVVSVGRVIERKEGVGRVDKQPYWKITIAWVGGQRGIKCKDAAEFAKYTDGMLVVAIGKPSVFKDTLFVNDQRTLVEGGESAGSSDSDVAAGARRVMQRAAA